MEPESSRHPTLLEEIAQQSEDRLGRLISNIEVLYGYLWRQATGRWRLYRSLDSHDYLEGGPDAVLAQRAFLTPAGDTLIYVRRGAEVKVHTDSVLGRPQYTSWHPPGPWGITYARKASGPEYTSWHPREESGS